MYKVGTRLKKEHTVALLPEYNQQNNEELLDWKYRLIFGKAKKEVKLSWDEISLLLGLCCSGEYLHKIAYGVLEYSEHLESKNLQVLSSNAETIIGELEMKRFEMEREKMRMQDQKRELNKQFYAEQIISLKKFIVSLKRLKSLLYLTATKVSYVLTILK
jgi:hypothetical protein